MEWKDIPGFDGYQVSDTGLVRTHNKTTYTETHGVRHWKDRILKPKSSNCKRNQHRVDLWKDGRPYEFLVARLEAFTFFGEDINNHTLTVNHKDGNWANDELSNLELVSLDANIKHGFENGLYSTCKRVAIINKSTHSKSVYRSMAKAGEAIGMSHSYISNMIKRGIYDNEYYKWELATDE